METLKDACITMGSIAVSFVVLDLLGFDFFWSTVLTMLGGRHVVSFLAALVVSYSD